ncbi:MAG: PAS domain S-box protein [Bacteroidia bacterium]
MKINLFAEITDDGTGISEDMLKKSEDNYRWLFEDHPIIKFTLDPATGNIVDANHTAAEFYGVAREDLKQMNLSQIIANTTPAEINSYLQQTVSHKDFHKEFKHRCAHGEIKDVDVYANTVAINNKQYIIHSLVFDITERKKALKALKISEKNLYNGEQLAKLGYWKLKVGDDKVFISAGTRTLFGTDKEVLTLAEAKSFCLPQYINLISEGLRALIEDNKPYNVECKIKRESDGEIIDVHSIAEYHPRSQLIFGIIQDITERKKAEEKIMEYDFFLRETQRIGKIGSYRLDIATGNWQSSDVLDGIFGIDANYQKNIPGWLNLIHPDDKQRMYDYLTSEVIGKQKPFDNSCRIISINNKQVKWTKGIGELKLDAAGNPTELIGTIQDITEWKIAEDKLLSLSQAVEQSPVSVIITDTEGNIQYVNQRCVETTGYSFAELIGENPRIFQSGETKPEVYKQLWEILLNGGEWHGELRNRKKNGELYWESVTISVIKDVRGETTHYLAVKEDITERKKIEEELIQSENQIRSFATRLNQVLEEERGRIAREIHDELGQQLTAFKMGVDWVLHKQTNPDSEVSTKLNELIKMSDAAVTSIRRISADLRPAVIDDLGLIAALEILCSNLNKTGIACHFISTVEERKFEDTFSINIYRIAQETLTNVVRHAQAKSVTVSLSESNTAFILEITDDGKGISQSTILQSKHLGIMGMKERANLLGGEFIIEGTKNKGTCTTLILPLQH